MRDAVIVASSRTPLAKSHRGSFNITRPDDLAAHCIRHVLGKVPDLADEEVEEVFAVLRKKEARMPTNWSRRFKNHVEKLKSGDIYQVAEVVRNLALRDHEKGLSTGEKQMYVKAKKILASELMYAKDMSEEQAAAWLDDVLSRAGQTKTSSRAKPKAAAASA